MKRSLFTLATLIIPMVLLSLVALPGCIVHHDDDHDHPGMHDDHHDDHDNDHHDDHGDMDHP